MNTYFTRVFVSAVFLQLQPLSNMHQPNFICRSHRIVHHIQAMAKDLIQSENKPWFHPLYQLHHLDRLQHS